LWETVNKGQTWQSEVLNKDKYDNFYWELSTAYPLRNENGDIVKIAFVKADINELKKVREELIKAKNKAEESQRLKNAFLANISHEINTPLNAISGFAQLLVNDSKLPDKHIEQLKIILKNTEVLVKIFNDIILYSKNDSGIIDVNTRSIELNNLILKICSKYNLLLIKNKKLPIDLKFLPDRKYSNVKINTDKELLSEIFYKLIDNAIKYTSEGNIIIKYDIGEDVIRFTVQDTGIGIPENDKENIFQLFYHGGNTFVSLHKGLGIGLNLVKSYLEILGGKIFFESSPDSGTKFHFTFPKHIVSYTN
jgi:signal transduction histidine kinase